MIGYWLGCLFLLICRYRFLWSRLLFGVFDWFLCGYVFELLVPGMVSWFGLAGDVCWL